VSRREAEVLALLGARLSNAEIAAKLHISIRTVENHVSSLLRKHQASDRRELGAIAASTSPSAEAVSGLPRSPTSFVGRGHERDAVVALLRDNRLVTLTGPGGVGKTRLASVIADTVPIGGAYVDLVPVREGFVVQAVAAALGVGEGAQRPLPDVVVDRLRDGNSLLVLDNCEHVIESAASFAQRVLTSSPSTSILATSRERLGVPGERVFPVAPLPLASDAERLFVERALAADPSFTVDAPAVAALCARLDGIPLAIELAAARAAALGVDGLLAALDGDLRVVTGGRGVDERHRSLHAVIDWSHDLLELSEREVFRRLAIFAGGFDLDAAAYVCTGGDRFAAADLLGRLVDKSLVVRLAGSGRWTLLETIRTFALTQLDISSELPEIEARHLAWATSMAEALLLRSGGSVEWYDDFDAIADDLRAALDHTGDGRGLARTLGRLAFGRRFLTEAVAHFEAAGDLRSAAAASFAVGPASRAYELLLEAARSGGPDAGIALSQAIVTACRFPSGFAAEIPHQQLVALLGEADRVADRSDPLVAAHLAAAEAWCASAAKYSPDPSLAESAVAAARAVGDPVLISAGLDALGAVAAQSGDTRAAYRIASERLAMLPLLDRGDPPSAAEILDTFHGRWLSALVVGDLPGALETAEAVLRDDLLGVHPYRAVSKLVPVLVLTGRFAKALELAPEMYAAWQRSGAPVAAWMAPALAAVAFVHGVRGEDAAYAEWMARASSATGGNPLLGQTQSSFLAFVEARVALHRGTTVKPDLTNGWFETYALAVQAELAVVQGSAKPLEAALAAEVQNDWATACLTRAQARLNGSAELMREAARAFERIDARFEHACTMELLPR
jgi:predicted ATPase/DNA-binding CsgD family transcriptional regulator